MTAHILRLSSILSVLALPVAAVANEPLDPNIPEGPCAKSITAIGAPLGHRLGTAPDGAPALYFVVRSEGREYDVRCDVDSGNIRDVARRRKDTSTQ